MSAANATAPIIVSRGPNESVTDRDKMSIRNLIDVEPAQNYNLGHDSGDTLPSIHLLTLSESQNHLSKHRMLSHSEMSTPSRRGHWSDDGLTPDPRYHLKERPTAWKYRQRAKTEIRRSLHSQNEYPTPPSSPRRDCEISNSVPVEQTRGKQHRPEYDLEEKRFILWMRWFYGSKQPRWKDITMAFRIHFPPGEQRRYQGGNENTYLYRTKEGLQSIHLRILKEAGVKSGVRGSDSKDKRSMLLWLNDNEEDVSSWALPLPVSSDGWREEWGRIRVQRRDFWFLKNRA
ncbi:hypothetical protein M501DRAFT_1018700 [Patellaria atrata CBS 101060]|uniref:Uncharacterized protein n=1 Tax=Patellaria atrata CBS 101060 TaxID=1346257 RepID=A0A9P4S619_9PEZI|nr:hypothetical protein M501DRAFT_1018700 [Patellaria atrata CBS 101060]